MAFGSSGDAASKHDDEKEAGHLQQGETVGLDWGPKDGIGILLTKYWYVHVLLKCHKTCTASYPVPTRTIL